MNIAVRAVEGFVGGSMVIFTVSWGLIESQKYNNFELFLNEMFPLPLILPLVAGLLSILNIELFVALMSRDEEDVLVSETEKRIGQAIATQAKKLPDWNSRWDQEDRE